MFNPVEGMKSEMDFFVPPLTSKQISESKYIWFQPRAPIENSEVIEFLIEGIADQYIDLSKTKLHITGKFVNSSTNADLKDEEMYCPVNLLFHALFKQADVLLNDKQITHGSQTYPYKAYLEKLLSFNQSAKDSTLQTSFYYEDAADNFNSVTYGDENPGAKIRHNLTKGSKSIQMSDKLHLDAFNIDRYIIGNVKVALKLTRSKPEFYTMRASQSNTGAAGAAANSSPVVFKIEDIKLKVFKIKPTSNLLMAHATMLLKTPANYIINNVQTKVYNVATGSQAIDLENIFLGRIPARIIALMIDVRAYEGDYSLNPFYFKHNHINNLYILKDGVQYPSQPYQPDFPAGKCLAPYEDMLECLDLWGRNKSNGITLDKYKKGFTFFMWDLTADMSASSNIFNSAIQGTVSFHCKFSTALTSNINLFIYGESKHIIQITLNGDVAVDYTV